MTTEAKTETNREALTRIASTNQTDERDDRIIAALLHKLGFPAAVCTCGIAYLEGKGTIDAPPAPVPTVAAMILKAYNAKGGS